MAVPVGDTGTEVVEPAWWVLGTVVLGGVRIGGSRQVDTVRVEAGDGQRDRNVLTNTALLVDDDANAVVAELGRQRRGLGRSRNADGQGQRHCERQDGDQNDRFESQGASSDRGTAGQNSKPILE